MLNGLIAFPRGCFESFGLGLLGFSHEAAAPANGAFGSGRAFLGLDQKRLHAFGLLASGLRDPLGFRYALGAYVGAGQAIFRQVRQSQPCRAHRQRRARDEADHGLRSLGFRAPLRSRSAVAAKPVLARVGIACHGPVVLPCPILGQTLNNFSPRGQCARTLLANGPNRNTLKMRSSSILFWIALI